MVLFFTKQILYYSIHLTSILRGTQHTARCLIHSIRYRILLTKWLYHNFHKFWRGGLIGEITNRASFWFKFSFLFKHKFGIYRARIVFRYIDLYLGHIYKYKHYWGHSRCKSHITRYQCEKFHIENTWPIQENAKWVERCLNFNAKNGKLFTGF